MATLITEDCINCGACEDECPNAAISMGSEVFVIDPQLCTECVGFSGEQLCATACPPDVCIQDPERIEAESSTRASSRCLGTQANLDEQAAVTIGVSHHESA